MARGIEWIKQHSGSLFALIAAVVGVMIAAVSGLLHALPAPLVILGAAALAWLCSAPVAREFRRGGAAVHHEPGLLAADRRHPSLVFVSTLVSILIGVPLGIAAGPPSAAQCGAAPGADLMQTLPTFVYLIPTLVLFGLGVVPALISTVIFALPAAIRLTQLGIASVRVCCSKRRSLRRHALAAALEGGITERSTAHPGRHYPMHHAQLSMVVIGALVGAGGLGVPVVRALNTVQIGMGSKQDS